jgi:hypothetical protein
MKLRYGSRSRLLPGLVAIIMLFVAGSSLEAAEGVLDGKTFVGQSGEKGAEADGVDEVRFKNGKLFSVGCAEWGFEKSDYTTKAEGDRITFESEMTSTKHGKIVWKGSVKGDAIDATYTWTKERWWWWNAHQEKWMKGSLKK